MTTTVTPDLGPYDYERKERPTLRPVPAQTTAGEAQTRSFDPTQGRQIGSRAYDDPTQGRQIGSHPFDDPTRAG